MSGDLISRKEAIDALHGSIFCADAIPIIEELPTAYDVEAVVRELEAEYEWHADTFHGTLDDDALGQMRAYDNAIRIVKRGGRND